jgi:hypothetical protein
VLVKQWREFFSEFRRERLPCVGDAMNDIDHDTRIVNSAPKTLHP